MAREFSDLLSRLNTHLTGVSGLVQSPVPLDPTALPSTLTGIGPTAPKAAFVLDIQSRDAGDRQGSLLRVDHTVTVSLLVAVRQGRWMDTLSCALDVEQDVIACLLDRDLFADYDVRWLGSSRLLTPDKAHLIDESTFRFTITQSTGST